MLEKIIKKKIQEAPIKALEPHFTVLKTTVAQRSQAILAYGSCLSEVTRSTTSTPDFYVVVQKYRTFHRSKRHWIVNWFLPPNIYHFEVDGRVSKYNVISAKDLIHVTSRHAPDCYNIGRFSKRIAVAWAENDSTIDFLSHIQASSIRQVARYAYPLLPSSFDLPTFVKQCLKLSYLADVRVEAEDKVDRLFEAEKEFYLSAYGSILEEMVGPPFHLRKNMATHQYQKVNRGLVDTLGRLHTRYFLSKSRFRSQLRWPKGIFTVDNWIDYLLAKIERTKGIHFDISPHEKKYWYIYAWKYFFQLRKKNLIK